jgi:hypothetical protein
MLKQTTNFREITMGGIPPSVLYRSNHPIRNGKEVESITTFAQNAQIKTIINLSDAPKSLKSKIIYCPWYAHIFKNNGVIALNIPMQFDSMNDGFAKKIKKGVLFMIEQEPPYLIHCEAGMDRTGFLAALLEGFMGTPFDDIVKDYMLSFVDAEGYSIEEYKIGAAFISNLFAEFKGAPADRQDDVSFLSKKYLLEKIGLSHKQRDDLEKKLMKPNPAKPFQATEQPY